MGHDPRKSVAGRCGGGLANKGRRGEARERKRGREATGMNGDGSDMGLWGYFGMRDSEDKRQYELSMDMDMNMNSNSNFKSNSSSSSSSNSNWN